MGLGTSYSQDRYICMYFLWLLFDNFQEVYICYFALYDYLNDIKKEDLERKTDK